MSVVNRYGMTHIREWSVATSMSVSVGMLKCWMQKTLRQWRGNLTM